MRLGKLPAALLEELLHNIPAIDERVLVGPRPGEDGCVLDMAGNLIVVTSDPVTFPNSRPGWYCVHVNANDVAVMGGEPAWFSATLLAPPNVDEAELRAVFEQITSACAEVGASLVTGHTEVTDAVTRTVVAGTMIGQVSAGRVTSSGDAQPGDALLLAGPAGLEGTALLAAEAAAELAVRGVTLTEIGSARGLLDAPGISVLPAVRVLRRFAPRALHDATEGGVATAVLEVAQASGLGVTLEAGKVPLLPVTRRICDALAIDLLGLISSGCLVVALDLTAAHAALAALREAGIVAAIAGSFNRSGACELISGGRSAPLPRFERDEVARYFDQRRDLPDTS